MSYSRSGTATVVVMFGVLLLGSGCRSSRCQPGFLDLFEDLQSLQVEHWQIGFKALAVGCGQDLRKIEADIERVRRLTRDHVNREGFLLMHTASDPEARAPLLRKLRQSVRPSDRLDVFFYELSFTELRGGGRQDGHEQQSRTPTSGLGRLPLTGKAPTPVL